MRRKGGADEKERLMKEEKEAMVLHLEEIPKCSVHP
jgi:hypothetical protein